MDPQLSDFSEFMTERSFSLAGFSHLVVPTPSSTKRGLVSRLGLVPCVASSCRWGGGDAVVLDGMWLRPRTYRGGTSSWTHPCSWTQRQLSITVYGAVRTVCGLWVRFVSTCVRMKNPLLLQLKENISFILKFQIKRQQQKCTERTQTNIASIFVLWTIQTMMAFNWATVCGTYSISFILGHIQDWLNMVCTLLQASFMQGKTANARILHSAENYFKYHRGPVHQYKWRLKNILL